MENVLDHIYLTSEADLKIYLDELNTRGVSRVALDMEGDQGTIHYHYAISIIQLFDGVKPVVIDVLALDKTDVLKAFLSDESITKVMFASSNDQFMSQNVLDCTLKGVRDIALAQKLLQVPINLANHLGIDKKEKDHHQRANWIKRPISATLLNYAINDVMILMPLEEELEAQLKEQKLQDEYLRACVALAKTDYRLDPIRLYSKRISMYRFLKPDKKHQLRAIWILRELIGQKVNRPVGHLISKKVMPSWVRKNVNVVEESRVAANKRLSPSQQLSHNEVQLLWEQAWEMARTLE